MSFIFNLHSEIIAIVKAIINDTNALEKIVLEPTKDPSHGDLATNAAMVCSKAAQMPPKDLANEICEKLNQNSSVASTAIAGPGFINISLTNTALHKELANILAAKGKYGSLTMGTGKSVNVEYVSTNPTGPLHIVKEPYTFCS